MSIISKIKEAIICFKAGTVTLSYPANPKPVPARFRGRPIFDGNKCVGCAGCANNCPAREILLKDTCQEMRIVKYIGRRCTYCGRCADVCPEKAITMSKEFETAHDKPADIQQNLNIWMSTCQRCGRCYKYQPPINGLMMKGFRADDLDAELWVYKSSGYLEGDKVADDIEITVDNKEAI